MRVLKFGGTSMSNEHTWRKVLDIVSCYKKPVVIVSATAHTTRQLVAAAEIAVQDFAKAKKISRAIKERHTHLIDSFLDHINHADKNKFNQDCKKWIIQCIKCLDQKLEKITTSANITTAQKDAISSIGEQLSAYLFACCARAYGLPAQWVDAREIIKTDSDYGRATPDTDKIRQSVTALGKIMHKNRIPVMGGFYGEDEGSHITTLGFEGSDYTASLVGAALDAKAVEIWTDVSGIYTCDPRVVKKAQPIPELSFREATEMASFGAKVLHPSTLQPAASKQIPVYVKNIFEPKHPCTKIHEKESQQRRPKAIAYLNDIAILTVTADKIQEEQQFLADVFSVLDNAKIALNVITASEASVSVALHNDGRTEKLQHALNNLGTITVKAGQGLISLIGCSSQEIDTIQTYVFSGSTEVKPTLISCNEHKQNLHIAVRETALIPAVCRIHDLLFE